MNHGIWIYFTFISCRPAENPCCIASSMRSAGVVTGVNATAFHALRATP